MNDLVIRNTQSIDSTGTDVFNLPLTEVVRKPTHDRAR